MRYMNPGYKDWFNVITDNSNITDITDTSKSKTGTGLANISPGNHILLDFPPSGQIWCRFDFFGKRQELYMSDIRDTWRYNALYFYIDSSGAATFRDYVRGGSSAKISQLQDAAAVSWGFKSNAVNSALLHFVWATDNSNGYFEFWANNHYFGKSERADLIPYETTQLKFSIFGNDLSLPISNIIISDEPISIKEQIVALPISSIQSDMTYNSDTGIYTATANNQSLLASVNVADLIADFGDSSSVTGVTVAGNPAYRTADGLSSFTAITKKNNVVTTYDAANISTESDSVVTNTFATSDTTLADLQNMQIGFKVGE